MRQAEQLVFNATATIADLERQIAQEHYISILLGRNPRTSVAASLEQQAHVPEVPVGLPSALLERRPDIQQAGQLLVAANANNRRREGGVFPQISLTGSSGVQSPALSDLFTKPAGISSIGAGLTEPISTPDARARA